MGHLLFVGMRIWCFALNTALNWRLLARNSYSLSLSTNQTFNNWLCKALFELYKWHFEYFIRIRIYMWLIYVRTVGRYFIFITIFPFVLYNHIHLLCLVSFSYQKAFFRLLQSAIRMPAMQIMPRKPLLYNFRWKYGKPYIHWSRRRFLM